MSDEEILDSKTTSNEVNVTNKTATPWEKELARLMKKRAENLKAKKLASDLGRIASKSPEDGSSGASPQNSNETKKSNMSWVDMYLEDKENYGIVVDLNNCIISGPNGSNKGRKFAIPKDPSKYTML